MRIYGETKSLYCFEIVILLVWNGLRRLAGSLFLISSQRITSTEFVITWLWFITSPNIHQNGKTFVSECSSFQVNLSTIETFWQQNGEKSLFINQEVNKVFFFFQFISFICVNSQNRIGSENWSASSMNVEYNYFRVMPKKFVTKMIYRTLWSVSLNFFYFDWVSYWKSPSSWLETKLVINTRSS